MIEEIFKKSCQKVNFVLYFLYFFLTIERQERKMKTKLLGVFISSLLCVGVAEARFYIGVEGGYLRNLSQFENKIYHYSINLTPNGPVQENKRVNLRENGVVGNLVLGTEHFIQSQYFGWRWGIFGGYGISWGKVESRKTQLNTIHYGFNTDFLVNFLVEEKLTSGFFVGVEYAITDLNPKKQSVMGLTYTVNNVSTDVYVGNKIVAQDAFLRAGFSTLVNKNHRVEVMAKTINSKHYDYEDVLNNTTQIKVDDTFIFTYQNIQALVSYKYVF